jgi:hypothetical protein
MCHSKCSRIVILCVLAALLAFDAKPAPAAQTNIFTGSLAVFAPVFDADLRGFFIVLGLLGATSQLVFDLAIGRSRLVSRY